MLSTALILSFVFVSGPLGADEKDTKKPAGKKETDKGADKKPDDRKKSGDSKPPKTPEAKLGDFSAYAKHSEYAGEVVKSDENSVTIRNTRRVKTAFGYRNEHTDVEFKYAEGGLARKEKAPKFFNEKGLERPATSSELEKLRKPAGAPGFHIERTDLKNGDLVKLVLVRPISIPAKKVKPEDLVIKFAVMVGEAVQPSAPPKK